MLELVKPQHRSDRPTAEIAKPDSLLVLLPAFNEAPSLKTVLDECAAVTARRNIVVVDDGSTDGTSAVAQRAGVACLELLFNMGKGAALQAGFRLAQRRDASFVVQLDADGQHDLAYLNRLLQPVLEGDCDIAVASRFVAGSGRATSFLRGLGGRVLSLLLWLSVRQWLHDCTSGYWVLNRRAVDRFVESFPSAHPETAALAAAIRSGLRVVEVPIFMRERAAGRSTLGVLESIWYMVQTSIVLLVYSFLPVARGGRDSG